MLNMLNHKGFIDSIFKKYNLPTSCYEIVPDVQKWCHDNDIVEDHPFRAAKCFCRTIGGNFYIVFREVQTDEMISSAKSHMKYCFGFSEEVEKLDSELKYLEHLVLHEISCKILGSTEQKLRDKWSFQEMGI